MDLTWLEDFASLARTGSFSRSALERHVTQSAFSRRIKALETWLGVPLVDRSTYPTTLTGAGRQFRETAEETVRLLLAGRDALQAADGGTRAGVSVAALHSLALTFFPPWLRKLEGATGRLETRLLADDFHSCVTAICEGGYDFLLTYGHPDIGIPLDPELFPHLIVGRDALVCVHAPDQEPDALPILAYAGHSYLGRIAAMAERQRQRQPRGPGRTHTDESAMADALKAMALEGHGLAWLPLSTVAAELSAGRLRRCSNAIPLEIRLYRNADRRRPVLSIVWRAAEAMPPDLMQGRTDLD